MYQIEMIIIDGDKISTQYCEAKEPDRAAMLAKMFADSIQRKDPLIQINFKFKVQEWTETIMPDWMFELLTKENK